MTRRYRNAASGRFAAARDAEADPERHVAERVRATPVLRIERMNDHMAKLHLGDGRVVHHFTAADGPGADPHDHAQWGFWSTIVDGGYTEERFALDGTSEFIRREAGDRFYVAADDIHRIVELHGHETWTLIEPDPHTGKDSGFYQWRDGVPHFRSWREANRGEDFHPIR